MHGKNKSIFFFCTIIAILVLSISLMGANMNLSRITIIAEPVIDIEPKSAAASIDRIEFVQSGGHKFDYDMANSSKNYFKTGEGAFTLKFFLSAQIPNNQRLSISLKSFDPTYYSPLILDLAMMDQLPWYLELILQGAGVMGLDALSILLSPTSTNEISTTIGRTAFYMDGEKYVYEWSPATTLEYLYSPSMFLGGLDVSFLLPLLPLLMPEFQLTQSEYIQDIKYGVTNIFTISCQSYSWFSWSTLSNGLIIGGQSYTSLDLGILNKDLTAPTYTSPEITQESAVNDWEIKIKIDDEFEGSGTNYENVYIEYSVNGGSWNLINDPMLLGDDGYLYGTLPTQLAGSEIRFRILYEDRAGNTAVTETFTFYANPLEIQPIAYLLIGIAVATVATIAATRIYRNRHQPRIITLPTKKKVDKYYKKVNKEGGNV